MGTKTSRSRAEAIFRQQGGVLRTARVLALGVHPRTLYALREEGRLVEVSRGTYRLADLPPFGEPDLITVAIRSPQAVICLVSALAFHEITAEIPHEVYIALPRHLRAPRLEHPPLRVFRLSGRPLVEGVETHTLDSVPVRVYSARKTVADCFKFRNKIGLDVAVEALRLCMDRKGSRPRDLLHYARICRVERIMLPYLEAIG